MKRRRGNVILSDVWQYAIPQLGRAVLGVFLC